ncbi:MAG TPA: FecR domain-containing protein, partial [Leptospiraceae bacterium]|nr:FecR domain-containing protein [Leptospiraceae bacterium]
IIVSVLLFLIFFFSVLLYIDFKRKIGVGAEEVIGIIRYKEKLIQRKIDGQVVWETVDRDTPISNRDSVRTADNSTVSIELNDKTQIDMDENSMILLDFSNQNINLDFAYGAFAAKRSENQADTKLNIKSGSKTIELNKSDVKLTKVDEKKLDIIVDKGNATIKTKEGESVIQKDQLASLKEEKVEIHSVPVKLNKPADRAVILGNEISAINFSWDVQTGSNADFETTLEIAEDYKFSKKLKKIPVKKEKNLELKLPVSTYYWRIITNSKNLTPEVSESRKLSIIKEEPIRLFSPVNNTKYPLISTNPIINFSWNTSEYASSYKLEIAKDIEFKEIIKTIDSHTNRFAIDSLGEGRYYSRVSARFLSQEVPPKVSESVTFSIEKKVDLDPVEIAAIENTATTVTAIEKEKFVLNWKGAPEYSSYEVQIAEDKAFQNIVETQKVNRNFLVPKSLKKNTYFWRVKGLTKDGKSSNYSSSRFEVREPASLELLSPADNAEFAIKPNEKIAFKWNKIDIYGTYKLEISDKPDFKTIYKSEMTTSFGVSLDGFTSGTYYVRLTLINQETNEELLRSKQKSFRIPLSISEPVLLYPVKAETVDMSDSDVLQFKWDTVPNAISYKFEMFQKVENGDKLLISDDTIANQYTIKDLNILDEGKFKWQVKAKVKSSEGKEYISPIAMDYFSISLKTSPSTAPEIISPRKQHIDKKF